VGALAPAGGGDTIKTLNAALQLTAEDDGSGVAQMRFSYDGQTWTDWEQFATQKQWPLLEAEKPQTIYAQVQDVAGNVSEPMATTITAAVIQQGMLLVANVGDSRSYLVREGRAYLITADHSKVQQQIDRGELTEREAKYARQKNIITRSLGSHDQVGVDTWWLMLAPGDKLLLCSDGVSNYVELPQLPALLNQPSLQQAVNHLIDTAYDRGSSDNMTAILAAILPATMGLPESGAP